MKAVLKIGYQSILLSDVKIASKVLELLSAGVDVQDEMYHGKIVMTGKDVDLEVKLVRSDIKITRKEADGREVPVAEIPNRKRLNGSNQLALPAPRGGYAHG
jgi:urease gamma subunit